MNLHCHPKDLKVISHLSRTLYETIWSPFPVPQLLNLHEIMHTRSNFDFKATKHQRSIAQYQLVFATDLAPPLRSMPSHTISTWTVCKLGRLHHLSQGQTGTVLLVTVKSRQKMVINEKCFWFTFEVQHVSTQQSKSCDGLFPSGKLHCQFKGLTPAVFSANRNGCSSLFIGVHLRPRNLLDHFRHVDLVQCPPRKGSSPASR